MGTPLFLFMGMLVPVVLQAGISINEFYPYGSPQQVEIYNSASVSADISGWHIDDNGGTSFYTIPVGTVLAPYSCAVFSSDFNLNKTTADTIRLFDATAPPVSTGAVLKDEFTYAGSTAGTSYARVPDGTGLFMASPNTFGRTNDNANACFMDPTPVPTPFQVETAHPTPEPTEAPSPEPPLAGSVLISEIMAYPEDGPEWVEIRNLNDRSVNLDGWFIDDAEGKGSSPKTFQLTLDPNGYRAVNLPSSMLNNSGDSVRLLDGKSRVHDAIEYGKAPKGKTFSRKSWDSDAVCETMPTKDAQNHACGSPDQIPSSAQTVQTSAGGPTSAAARTLPPRTLQAPYLAASVPTAGSGYPDVLGAQDGRGDYSAPDHAGTARHLSFLSLSYSFLTLLSVLIKIRNVP